MRLSKLLAAAKIPYGGADREIERVVCDSRAAGKRTLFVCIRGFASDGHNFAARAYAAGCRTFSVRAGCGPACGCVGDLCGKYADCAG